MWALLLRHLTRLNSGNFHHINLYIFCPEIVDSLLVRVDNHSLFKRQYTIDLCQATTPIYSKQLPISTLNRFYNKKPNTYNIMAVCISFAWHLNSNKTTLNCKYKNTNGVIASIQVCRKSFTAKQFNRAAHSRHDVAK